MALELASTSLSVVLLESGGFDVESDTQELATGEIAGLPTFPLVVSRLRCFGGATGHWGGRCRPLDASDFAERPWVPHSGWPITLNDVLPHYVRAQEICQLGAYDYDPASWDLRDSPPLRLPGGAVGTRLLQISPPTHFGVRYRTNVVKAPNVRLTLHSNVVQIVPEANGQSIKAVEVATLAGKRFTVRARSYVLATGGVENPRLLLASDRVIRGGIGNQHDLVGRYFADHINLDTAGVFPLETATSYDLYQQDSRARTRHKLDGTGRPGALLGMLDLSPHVQQQSRTLNFMAELSRSDWSGYFLHSDRFDFEMDSGQSALRSKLAEAREVLSTLWRNLSDAVARPFQSTSEGGNVFYRVITEQEQAPNPESRVTLGATKDRLGIPRARLAWRLTELDRHTIKVAVKEIAGAMGTTGMARVKALWDLDATDWPVHMQSSWHHCGTTRMHADPKRGVVDADCRVHGISNLYIAGSSVFPINGSANPTLTIVALSLRLAQHLKQTLQ
ncbi:MAG TPA: GMC family oxidoreductase [Steroidobacteraceae bacterium]|nr:GMC family oxidoreductase [Steroidobacteraceae bacterium]